MVRLSAAFACGALLAVSARADAQPVVSERLRLQASYITERRPAPQPRFDDFFVSAVPELVLAWEGKESLVTVTYSLTGALHSTAGASELANRLSLQSSIGVGKGTTLIVGATGAQTSLSNLLISQPAPGTNIAIYPGAGNRLITATALQGLVHELTPRLRLDQHSDANVITTLAPSPPLDTFFFGAGAGLERTWQRDGLGIETRAVYAIVRTVPPTPEQQFITYTLGPRWRHDWSATLSSLLTAGGTVIFSPEQGTKPLLAPSARATLLYTVGDTSADVSVGTGVVPSPLTGQVIQSHQAIMHATTPISQHARVYAGGSLGYQRASLVDLTPANNDFRFDSLLADAEVTWAATPYVQVFARYQFVAQLGEINTLGVNPSFLRDLVLVGVQLSSRPPLNARAGRSGGVTGSEVVTRVPQRVDRSDTGSDPEPNRPGEGDPQPPPPAGGGGTRWIYTTPPAPQQPAAPR